MLNGLTIQLRDMQLDDLSAYRHWQQPGRAWQALDGPYYQRPSPEEIDKQIERVRERILAANWPEPRTRLVIANRQSNELLGMVSRYWISEETRWAALGILIYDAANWRKGIGYEALGLWADYLFTEFHDSVRLDLRTWSGNNGMMGLARKLGFCEEARFRRARIVEGAYFDGLGFGILRDEWAAQFAGGFLASMEKV